MRQESDWTLYVGCVALLATLLLGLPGVQAVRADDNVAETATQIASSGESCEADSVIYPSVVRIRLPQTAAAKEDPDSVPVALNGWGNDYGTEHGRTAVHPDKR